MSRAAHSAILCWLVAAFPLTLQAQSGSSFATSAPASPASHSSNAVTLASGQRLLLELEQSLHTGHNKKGDQAYFTTVNETLVGYQVAIPAGSSVRAMLTKVNGPGRAGRRAQIRLQFEEIVLPDGTSLPLAATLLRAGFTDVTQSGTGVQGEGGAGKRGAATVAVGAAQGAILGSGIGGAKGAAYGGAVGAGIGLLSVLLRRGPHLDLPRGTLFEVELNSDLAVPMASVARFTQGANAGALSANAATGSTSPVFTFPADPTDRPAGNTEEESVPDFEDEEGTSTVATNRVPPTTGPAPPPFDPTLDHPDAFRLRVEVPLVLVEAFVRDQRGQPFDNLKREDFRLWEDGVEQSVRHFSRDELPLAVALVVDRSGSVAPFMSELRRAAYQTLTQLKPGDQVALFAFDSNVDRLVDLTTNRRRIAERISRIRASGGTNILDALFTAAHYLSAAAPDQRRTLILISDNQATVRGHASQGRVIRLALEGGVVIYSIKTPGEPTPVMMRLPTWITGTGSVDTMTRETGGEIIDVYQVGSLQAALAAVVSRLKTRYTLGYQSTNRAHDGSFRKIEVRLADRFGRRGDDYRVHARSGYYAPTAEAASQTTGTR